MLGRFICIDETTTAGTRIDATRIRISVNVDFKLMERSMKVSIDDMDFTLVLREDSETFQQQPSKSQSHFSNYSSSESEAMSADYCLELEDEIKEYSCIGEVGFPGAGGLSPAAEGLKKPEQCVAVVLKQNVSIF